MVGIKEMVFLLVLYSFLTTYSKRRIINLIDQKASPSASNYGKVMEAPLFSLLIIPSEPRTTKLKTMNNQFVKDSLLPDEKILATAKFHPIKMWFLILIFTAIFTILLFGLYMEIIGSYLLDLVENGDFINIMVIGIMAIGTGYFACRITKWIFSFDEFVITNKRVVAKVGVIRKIAFELQSEQVESIEIHQGIIGRILKFGTLMPCGIGASKVRIRFVVNPFEFRQHFYDIKKISAPSPAKSQPSAPQAPTTEQKYFAQPQSDGKFHIVEKNSVTGEFVTIKGEVYDTEFEARKRAKELNAEYNS